MKVCVGISSLSSTINIANKPRLGDVQNSFIFPRLHSVYPHSTLKNIFPTSQSSSSWIYFIVIIVFFLWLHLLYICYLSHGFWNRMKQAGKMGNLRWACDCVDYEHNNITAEAVGTMKIDQSVEIFVGFLLKNNQ